MERVRREHGIMASRLESLVHSGEQYILDRAEWQKRLEEVETRAATKDRVFQEERAALIETVDRLREQLKSQDQPEADAVGKMRAAAAKLRRRGSRGERPG